MNYYITITNEQTCCGVVHLFVLLHVYLQTTVNAIIDETSQFFHTLGHSYVRVILNSLKRNSSVSYRSLSFQNLLKNPYPDIEANKIWSFKYFVIQHTLFAIGYNEPTTLLDFSKKYFILLWKLGTPSLKENWWCNSKTFFSIVKRHDSWKEPDLLNQDVQVICTLNHETCFAKKRNLCRSFCYVLPRFFFS